MNTRILLTLLSAILVTVPGFSQYPTMPSMPQMAQPTIPEKRPGVIRIGIVTPMAEMGKDFSMQDTPYAVGNTLEVALTGETVETIQLVSALPDREAVQKKCDYVFYSKVRRKKGGGGMFGSMGPMLGGMAGMIPGVGGIVGTVAASTVITATTVAGGFKSKDEVAFEYGLVKTDGSVVIPSTVTKQKAKKDGDDVLTPQIAAAAKAALEAIEKLQAPATPVQP